MAWTPCIPGRCTTNHTFSWGPLGLEAGEREGASAHSVLSPLPLKANATGGGGHVQMVQRAMQDLTYASLCFPEAIKARGMDSTQDIPYYFYRDDGLLVWEAIRT